LIWIIQNVVMLLRVERCVCSLYAGLAEARWNLARYQDKDELIRAIEALPMVAREGNDISGAMRTLRTEVLAFGYRGYNNYVQKVALTFVDRRASNNRDLVSAHQVLQSIFT